MNTFGSFLLQMTCWLAAFWLVYTLVLKHETFFKLNRYFLTAGLLLSSLLPLVPVTYKIYKTVEPMVYTASEFTPAISNAIVAKNLNYWLIAYLAGCSFYLGRLIIQHINLYRIRKQNPYSEINSIKIYTIDKETVPFSLFNHIYISSKLRNNTELNTIIAHEKVHINERHWTDLILLEVVRTLQWFNPLLLLYRKAIMQNHEYLADTGTLNFGVSARTYKAVLVNQMLDKYVLNFASSFTINNSTKRLLMMKKDKSTPIKKLKVLLIIPLTAVIMMSFAKPEYVYSSVSTNANQVKNDTKSTLPDNTVNSSLISEELPSNNLLSENNTKAINMSIKGEVTDEKGTPIENAIITHLVANGQLKSKVTSDQNGNFTIDNVQANDIITVSHPNYESYKTVVQNQHYLKVQLKLMVKSNANIQEDEQDTESEPKSIEVVGYGSMENNQSEVIPITKMETPPPPAPGIRVIGTVTDEKGNAIAGACAIISGSSIGTVTDIDGKFILASVNPTASIVISHLGYEKVVSPAKEVMNISLKNDDKNATNEILITDKPKPPQPASDVIFRSKDGTKPLLVVDDEISEIGINTIPPEIIESITVLKNEAATKLYGEKGKNGVIIIITKEHSEKADNSFIEEEIFFIVEKMPEFKNGGDEGLREYIQQNIQYPKTAYDNGIQGKVYVQFIVNNIGEVVNAKVVRGVDPALDEEALRIVNSLPDWTPGFQRGKPVNVSYTVPIKFTLN